MYFNATAYQILLPTVLLLLYKQIEFRNNCITVLNYTYVLYAATLVVKLYHLLVFIQKFASVSSHYTLGAFEVRLMLIVMIAVLLLFKKMEHNIVLSIIACSVLWMNDYDFSFQNFSFEIVIKILNYCSLFTGIYALLWLLKKLPSQQITNV